MIHGNIHIWDNRNGAIMVSHEDTKTLKSFKDIDDIINYLFLNGHKDTARKLHKEGL